MLALIVFIVFIQNAERRIPVQYAKRVVGRKMYGGQASHIPMKVNMLSLIHIYPHGLRVGVIKDWDSRWYARNEKVGDLLVEDNKIRSYLKKTLYSAGIPKIEIERDSAKVRIYLPVSYTHLDVYKRQDLFGGKAELLADPPK